MIKRRPLSAKTCPSLAEKPVRHQLLILFWMLGPAYARWGELVLGKVGTTPQRLRLLAMLCEQGPMKMSELRDEMGVTGTNITGLVDALEKEGKVRRKPHHKDRRATLIEVTPKAKEKFSAVIGGYRDKGAELFSGFSPGEQEQLLSFLYRIKDALVERKILAR